MTQTVKDRFSDEARYGRYTIGMLFTKVHQWAELLPQLEADVDFAANAAEPIIDAITSGTCDSETQQEFQELSEELRDVHRSVPDPYRMVIEGLAYPVWDAEDKIAGPVREEKYRMTMLNAVHQGREAMPRRTLLYGVQGVGKSTFGAMSDRPIFIQTEDGLGDIECHKFPLARSHDDVIAALGELFTEKHEYHTVVLDSLDWLERLIHAQVCKKRCVESIEDIGFAKGYTFALTHWREVLRGLDALRAERDMSVILIAHAKIERFENPETEAYDRYTPRLHKLASALLQEWSDDVLFATYRVHTRKIDENFGRAKHRGISTGERIIRTTERPAHIAKNRLGLPEEFPLDYRKYAAFVRGEDPLNAENQTAERA